MESKNKLGRLNQKADFLRLSKTGKKIRASDWLLMLALPNEVQQVRIGFSVSSQLAPAVTRNKLKRWSRSLVARAPVLVLNPKKGLDVHLIFRAPRAEKSSLFYKNLKFTDLTLVLENAFEKIK